MTAILGRTGNLVGFTTGRGTTPWNTEMEAALRKMDAMLASTVVAITNTLPGSANEGDLYLVGTSPTGVAAGWANRIARWRSSPAGWEAYQPMQGWIVTIVGESTNKVRRYDGTAWVALAADTDHTHAYIPTAQKGATNGVAELGADGKVPSAQLPASSSPIVSVAKTMEFALANEVTINPVQILTVPVPVGFFTTNGLIELDLDLDLLYVASGNRMTLNFEVGVSPMWIDWIDDIPADAPRVFHGYIGKYKVESGETYVRMIGTLNGVRVSGEYHDDTYTVAGQTSFSVSGHVGIEGVGAHVNCAVAKVFA